MNTGAKIAIGCGIAALLAGLAVVLAIGGAVWFVKDQADSMIADQEEIEALKEEVNAQPWEAPADGIVAEDRLQAFLEIRERVHGEYEKYADLIDQNRGDDAELADVGRAFTMLSDLRRAQARAQAEIGMGDDEYAWLVGQVYSSMWAGQLEETTGETSAAAATEQAIQALEEQLAEAEGLPPEQREALEQQIDAMRAGAAASAGQLEVPPENVELFRRYQDRIEQHAMPGLELLAL